MALDYEIFELGDVRLQRGATLRSCQLAYKTFGSNERGERQRHRLPDMVFGPALR